MNLPLWIVVTQWASRAVLFLLFGLSVWSVATMMTCARLFKEEGAGKDFAADFEAIRQLIAGRKWGELRSWLDSRRSLYTDALKAALEIRTEDPGRVDRYVRSFLSLKKTALERGLTTLATLGSNAPFIGLFGTVLGVIQAFGALGAQASNTAQIMVGISEALVATAVGLFVAIPAVIAFNVFSRQLKVLLGNSECLRDLYLSAMEGGR
jgi:biopolymer transport protein ExbB